MRVIIRGDLDGIVCATMLKSAGLADTAIVASIEDIINDRVEITDQDIICNLPYQAKAGLWFDHHATEATKLPSIPADFRGSFALAPSTARVVYKYLLPNNPKIERFAELIDDVDTLDSADLTQDDVLKPQGSILLGLLLDPRTHLDSGPVGKESYYAWKTSLPDLLLEHSVDEILAMPETQQWSRIYEESQVEAIRLMQECSHLEDNVIVSDFRGRKLAPVNRFIIYTLPGLSEGNISVQIADGEPGVWNEIAVGHSIFNRSSAVDVGELCSWYRGGGHRTVGVCRPSIEDSEQAFREIITACKDPFRH